MRQVIQRCDDRPAIHLRLIDLLSAMVETGRIAKSDCVSGGEEAKSGMWTDDAVLVEQRQAARGFQDALDDEHDVGPAGIILVENKGGVVLIAPGKNALAEFRDLLSFLENDGILADEVDAADVAVEVDPDARPIQARSDLLDVGRFAGAMVAGDNHPTVVGKARQDGQGRLAIEDIIFIEIGVLVGGMREGGHLEAALKPEKLVHRYLDIGEGSGTAVYGIRHGSGVSGRSVNAGVLVIGAASGKRGRAASRSQRCADNHTPGSLP